jgi:hypothetical protein
MTLHGLSDPRGRIHPGGQGASDGAIVISRRGTSGMLRARKHCMTTWPASVPTLVEASSASARRAIATRLGKAAAGIDVRGAGDVRRPEQRR